MGAPFYPTKTPQSWDELGEGKGEEKKREKRKRNARKQENERKNGKRQKSVRRVKNGPVPGRTLHAGGARQGSHQKKRQKVRRIKKRIRVRIPPVIAAGAVVRRTAQRRTRR